jgi:purine-binding chemotaxis protein CheW
MAKVMQYVTLGLDRELFGMPVENVREILDMREVSRLPHAPSSMLGIIDVRGRSVPIVDLRTTLGLPSAAATSSTRIIVLELPAADGRTLVADRVLEVMELDLEQMEPPPEIGARWRSDYITGIGRRGDAFVVVFDLARLFASDEVALIGGSVRDAAAPAVATVAG